MTEPMTDAELSDVRGQARWARDVHGVSEPCATVGETERLIARLDAAEAARDAALARVLPRPISEAPKDRPIVALCEHGTDPYADPNDSRRLTPYGAWCEGNGHVVDGWHVVEWGGAFADGEDDGGANMPDWWFLAGSDFEIAANPVSWLPVDLPTPTPTQEG